MFGDGVLPLLETKLKKHNVTTRTFGLTEEEILSLINRQGAEAEHGIEVNVLEKFPECSVIIRYSAKTPKVILDEFVSFVHMKLNEFIFSTDNQSLSNIIVDILETRNKKVSIVDGASLGELTRTFMKENNAARYYVTHNSIYVEDIKSGHLPQSDIIYNIVLDSLRQSRTDFCVGVFIDEESPDIFYVVIGDKNNIHIFKEAYRARLTSFEECVAKTALFYFMKKLKYGN